MSTTLRVLVAGSRSIIDYAYIRDKLLQFIKDHPDQKIIWITGRCSRGPDDIVYHFAKWDQHMPFEEYPADWDANGKVAGFIRNAEMAKVADVLLSFWDGESSGTKDMIKQMKGHQKKDTRIWVLDPEDQEGHYELFDFSEGGKHESSKSRCHKRSRQVA